MQDESTDTTARWLLGGGMLAALTASLCCIGPTAFMLLGLGGFVAAGLFETLRPWFLGLSALVLAFAWYRVFFRIVSCLEGETCSVRQSSKASKVVLVLVTLAAITLGAYPQLAEFAAQSGEPTPTTTKKTSQTNQTRLEVSISGMDCVLCATGIQRVLRESEGVIGVSVDYDAKLAVIDYQVNAVDEASLIATINQTGFNAKKISGR